MATVKLQNGKVITKDGKASCECCGCNEDFSITDQNVFQITKAEHDAYKKGGTWSSTSNISFTQSASFKYYSGTRYETLTGNGQFQKQAQPTSGCVQNIQFGNIFSDYGTINLSLQTTTIFPDYPPQYYTFNFTGRMAQKVQLKLKYYDNKFYAKYIASAVWYAPYGIIPISMEIYTSPPEFHRPFPWTPTVESCVTDSLGLSSGITIDGNLVQSCYTYIDIFSYNTPPARNGSYTMSLSFTPQS